MAKEPCGPRPEYVEKMLSSALLRASQRPEENHVGTAPMKAIHLSVYYPGDDWMSTQVYLGTDFLDAARQAVQEMQELNDELDPGSEPLDWDGTEEGFDRLATEEGAEYFSQEIDLSHLIK